MHTTPTTDPDKRHYRIRLLRFALFAAILSLGTYGANAQIGIGIRIGPPPPPES